MKEFIIAKIEDNYRKQSVKYRCFPSESLDEELLDMTDCEDFKNGTTISDGKFYIYGANFYDKDDNYLGTNTVEISFKYVDAFLDKYDYDRVEDFYKDCEELFNASNIVCLIKE